MSDDTASKRKPLCPSAQPDWQGSALIGVVVGSAAQPNVVFLDEAVPVTDEMLTLTGPVSPTEVLRIAAPCACLGCLHFKNQECHLVKGVVEFLPEVTDDLPPCAIRANCRWWLQEGRAACLRCPQVVTSNYNPSEAMMHAARVRKP